MFFLFLQLSRSFSFFLYSIIMQCTEEEENKNIEVNGFHDLDFGKEKKGQNIIDW